MCGIAGIVYRDPGQTAPPEVVARMSALIQHRGPDGDGVYVDGNVTLIHRRLSVIDIDGGRQPMRDAQRGRTIVFNGEIYNYRALRESLSGRDRAFRTNSDTEVLLALADADDLGWIEGVNGMFAFALWDEDKRSLSLFRDRLGIKPLYYASTPEAFVFASEIKPLLAFPGVARTVNTARIAEYLAFRTVVGEETLFDGIREVPPATLMRVSGDARVSAPRRYWTATDPDRAAAAEASGESPQADFEALMTQAVRHRLVADVPVGSFNSGGVDSSLNAAIMRKLTGEEIHTFSVGYDEAEYDESRYSDMIARHIGSDHHALVVTRRDYIDNYEKTLWHLEEPIGHAHTVQLMLLSGVARQFVTVALTGEGADEVFGGYPRLQIPALAGYFRAFPTPFVRLLCALSRRAGLRRAVKLLESAHDLAKSITENARYVPEDTLRQLLPHDAGYPERLAVLEDVERPGRSAVSCALDFDQRTYLPPLLNRLDKASMAVALECRVPFLDYRLVEWSFTLPDRLKIRPGRENKVLVKQIAENWLPKEIIYRRKVGFGTPTAEWIRQEDGLKPATSAILDSTAAGRGYFDQATVERLFSEHVSGARDHHEALWGLLGLEHWHRQFIDADPTAACSPDVAATQESMRLGAQEIE